MFARRAARLGAAVVITLVLSLAGLFFIATAAGAPPEHDIVPPNTTTLTVRVVSPGQDVPTHRLTGPLAPTTSLATARCMAWQQQNASECPSAAILAQTYWPGLLDQPQVIYVGLLWPYCIALPPHFNVEFFGGIGSSVLTLHCHSAGSWDGSGSVGGSNATAAPFVQLVVVPIASMQGGQVWVYREDRVERWLGDDVRTTLLGVVTIH